MLDHYLDLLSHYKLEPDDHQYLMETGTSIIESYQSLLRELKDTYYKTDFDLSKVSGELNHIADCSSVSIYTINFIFLAICSENMRKDYIEKSYGEDLFWATIEDLKYKLYESKTVKGVLGVFCPEWYDIFFRLKLFKLGRLEYEIIEFPLEIYQNDKVCIKKGDTAYSVHIPSSGKLSAEIRYDSYKKAYEFFECEKSGIPLVCYCYSWLLYEDNKKIFPERSNLVEFMGDWDIIASETVDDFDNDWRIFGMPYKGNESSIPRRTSLQKAMATWLDKGNKTGIGTGILIYDGE